MTTRWGSRLAAVSAAALLLAGCTGDSDGPDRADVGAQYVAVAGHLTGRTSTLQTPQGRWDVRVGTPRTSITEIGSAAPVRAPDGGSFVEVELEQGPLADAPLTGEPAYPRVRASLVADGRAYRLDLDELDGDNGAHGSDDDADTAMTHGYLPYGAAFVAVAGRPKTLSLRIDQGGITQSVDVRTGRRNVGGAAALYADKRAVGTHSCGTQRNPATVVPDYRPCTISWVRTAWLGGKGYAPAGKAWLVARVGIGTNTGVEVPGTDNFYDLDLPTRLSLRWSGGALDRVGIRQGPADPTAYDDSDIVAFAVPATGDAAGTLTVTIVYRLEGLGADEGSPPPGVRIGQSVPVSWKARIR